MGVMEGESETKDGQVQQNNRKTRPRSASPTSPALCCCSPPSIFPVTEIEVLLIFIVVRIRLLSYADIFWCSKP